ncbi:imm11 family protein [Ruegeria sp. Ofav3-42]|uniref:imm11 family protein n=1 Tax=Ruegeria sp. Ofav3-42 TaxID=2917759 RepID=UPI001EF48780|nr:DUF1629 domain-containing protein [Ruegeria sp. Ofav3-42]MCG7522589.1 hypothetical protein [Ruegeria sp. Ofav3-42]
MIQKQFGGRFYGKFRLIAFDEAEKARVTTGVDLEKEAETKYILTHHFDDPYMIEFLRAERARAPEHVARKLKLAEGAELPDFIESSGTGYVVSAKLKGIIELHLSDRDGMTFFPLEIYRKDGTLYSADFFAWNVYRKVDAVDPICLGVATVAGPVDGNHMWTYRSGGGRTAKGLKLMESEIEGLTAWRDFRFRGDFNFISDALLADMEAEGIEGFEVESLWGVV